jgi:hypothetical protein
MKYVWSRERHCFVDPKTDKPMDLPKGNVITLPQIVSDLPAYMSPLGTGLIDGRRARREDLKRNNCREVDPGTWTPSEAFREREARKARES